VIYNINRQAKYLNRIIIPSDLNIRNVYGATLMFRDAKIGELFFITIFKVLKLRKDPIIVLSYKFIIRQYYTILI